jgi:opacity protein-like surface antigen
MKRGRGRRVLGLALLPLAWLWAGPALSGPDNIELGLHYSPTWPQMDATHLSQGRSFGLLFHYWLNDTTAIDAALDQFDNVWKVSEPHGRSADVDFKMYLISAGARYSPEIDFFLSPYFGAGLAYQLWNTTTSAFGASNANGTGLAYYLLGGAEYRVNSRVAVGPYLRFVYVPFHDKMEESARVVNGKTSVDKVRLEQVGFFSTGLAVTVQIK